MEDQESRRRNTRVPVEIGISLIFPNRLYEQCKTRDLCLSGLWVYDCLDQKMGERCEIEISEKQANNIFRIIRMRGEVVRVDNEGIAILFRDMNFRSYTDLQTILLYHSEDPYTLAEEFVEQFGAKQSKEA